MVFLFSLKKNIITDGLGEIFGSLSSWTKWRISFFNAFWIVKKTKRGQRFFAYAQN